MPIRMADPGGGRSRFPQFSVVPIGSTAVEAAKSPANAGEREGPVALPPRTSKQRLRLLLRLSESLAAANTVGQVADTITTVAGQYLGAMFGGVAVIDESRRQMEYVSLATLPETLQQSRRRFDLSSSRPAAIVARERRALFIDSLDAARRVMDAESMMAANESGGQAFAYVPMLVGDAAVGGVVLIWAEPRTFTAADQGVLWALARYGGQAVERARLLAEQRQVAHTLQAALLPVLPKVGWIELYGRYQPANLAQTVGGDWYDAFISVPAPSDRPWEQTLTVVVGDVSGHDTYAAAEMGRLQAKLRALAIDHPDEPHALLKRLDRVMRANVHNRLATAVVANLQPRPDGAVTVTWSNAGHPPPLILELGCPPRYLSRPPDRLLGLDSAGPDRNVHSVTLAPGTVVLMFTDGLVERRGEGIYRSLDMFARIADHHRSLPLPEIVDALVARASSDNHDDDIVLFGLQVPSRG